MGYPLEVRVRGHGCASCQRIGGEWVAGHPESAGRTAQQSQQQASTIARNHPELVEEPPPPATWEVRMGGEDQHCPGVELEKLIPKEINTGREKFFIVKFTFTTHYQESGS